VIDQVQLLIAEGAEYTFVEFGHKGPSGPEIVHAGEARITEVPLMVIVQLQLSRVATTV
jgi:hypothetical protein